MDVQNKLVTFICLMTCSTAMCVCEGAQNTWLGGTDADWSTPGNWSAGRIPTNGDSVIIDSISAARTNILLTNSTWNLDSLTIGNCMLTFSNWNTVLSAANITIYTGGVFTLPPAFTNNGISNSIRIICTNLTLDAGGRIDANGKGYAGGAGPADTPGHGPGGGGCSGSWSTGGGHGGRGGRPGTTGNPGGGAVNGTAIGPNPGSGGGGVGAGGAGGNGGGLINIDASTGTLTLNGIITANGSEGAVYYSGGGSGGGIKLLCRKIDAASSGNIQAIGGDGGGPGNRQGGRGGGGRIAIIYDPQSQNTASPPEIRLSVIGATNGTASYFAENGTVYMPDVQFLTRQIVGTNANVYGVTNWTLSSLTFTSCTWTLYGPSMRMLVTNTLMVGSNGYLGLHIETSRLDCANLVLTNGGQLAVYSGPTNSTTADYGTLVNIADTVWIGSNSWLYPYSDPTNGGAPLLVMKNLILTGGTNGGIDATACGFAGTKGYGAGQTDSSGYGGGGGYGGCGGGGGSSSSRGGLLYGISNASMIPGSGGGGTYGSLPGRGGGLIRIEAAGMVIANGTLRANGGSFLGSGDAGGSGGGIMVACAGFTGSSSGLIEARGGNGNPTGSGAGGGGGGRICIWVEILGSRWADIRTGGIPPVTPTNSYAKYLGAISVTNGTGKFSGLPYDGTMGASVGSTVFLIGMSPATILLVR